MYDQEEMLEELAHQVIENTIEDAEDIIMELKDKDDLHDALLRCHYDGKIVEDDEKLYDYVMKNILPKMDINEINNAITDSTWDVDDYFEQPWGDYRGG